MTDYTKLDAAIVAQVSARPMAFYEIFRTASVKAALKPLTEAQPEKDGFRFVDNRLQALRKRGLIKHSGKTGWSAVEQEGKAP